MSRNKSGVVIQGAANKAELNYKYEKLQLILIDEIRLIYYKKLTQEIHSIYQYVGCKQKPDNP